MRVLVLAQEINRVTFEIAGSQIEFYYCASVMAATAIVEEINPRAVFIESRIRGAADFLKWLKRETGCTAVVMQNGEVCMDYYAWGADLTIQNPTTPTDIEKALSALSLLNNSPTDDLSVNTEAELHETEGFWDITDSFDGPKEAISPKVDCTGPPIHVLGQEVISIWGAQGGAGKTTLALLLSEALGEFDVLLVDLNFKEGPGDVNSLLELPISPHIGKLLDCSEDRRRGFSDCLIKPKHAKFAVIQPPPTIDQAENISPDDIIELIDQARRMFQVIILDLPDDLSPLTLEAIDMSTSVLMMATNNSGGIARIESLKSFIRKDIVKALVLNRFDEAKGRAKDIAHFLDMPLGGVIRTIREIETLSNRGRLLKLSNNVTEDAINDILNIIFGLDRRGASSKKSLSGMLRAGLSSIYR